MPKTESQEAKDKLAAARIRLLLEQPFFGNLIMFLDPVECKAEDMATMGTDGKHLYYNPAFVMKLTKNQLVTVLVHEVGHIALSHLTRMQGRHPQKWNFAADFAINDLIVSTTDSRGGRVFEDLPGWLYWPKYSDKSAEEIYNDLPNPPKGKKGQGQGQGQGQGDDADGDGDGDSDDGDGDGKSKPNLKGKSTLDDHGKWGDFDKDQSAEDHQQEWKDRIAAAAQNARTRGTMPGAWKTVVDDFLQPKLDWKTIITDVIVSNAKNDYRLFPPNKKFIYRGIYLPSMRGEEINIAFGIDVSGSISDSEIIEAISEVHGICEQFTDYKIYLFTFDTRITGTWEIAPFDDLPKIFSGRGGTDFDDFFRTAEKLPVSTLIVFSDLEAPFPKEPLLPTVWLSVGSAKPPFGLVVEYPRK